MLANLTAKIDNNHAEDVKRSKADRIEQIMLVLYGFALATTGLTLAVLSLHETIPTIISGIMAFGFWFLGLSAFRHLKKYKDTSWRNFWGE